MGGNCDTCLPGYYGDPRRGEEGDCKPCACPLLEPTNQFSASCQLIPQVGNYDNYKCDKCAVGYTGNRCERSGSCYKFIYINLKLTLPLVNVCKKFQKLYAIHSQNLYHVFVLICKTRILQFLFAIDVPLVTTGIQPKWVDPVGHVPVKVILTRGTLGAVTGRQGSA